MALMKVVMYIPEKALLGISNAFGGSRAPSGDRIRIGGRGVDLGPGSPSDSRISTQEARRSRIVARQEARTHLRNTRASAPQIHEGNGNDHDDERVLGIRELEAKLEKANKEADGYRKHCDDLRNEMNKELDEVRKDRDGARKERDESRKERDGVRKERDESRVNAKNDREIRETAYLKLEAEGKRKYDIYSHNYKVWEKQKERFKKNYDAGLAEIAKQKLDINELTVEMSRSVKTGSTTTRGDDYFDAKFASLEGAIRQWVFRSFRGTSDLKHQDLLPTVRDSLKATVFEYDPIPASKVNLKEIEAVVVERLRAHVFCPLFVLTIQEQYRNLDCISEALGGTDLEKREWHAQTTGMIFDKDHYEDHLRHGIQFVEKDLQDCLGFLSKGDSDEQRRKPLLAIVEQAAKLQVEIFRQVSIFQLHQISPGEQYDPRFMDDISGLVDEDEDEDEETQTFIVRVVVFPAVIRQGFDGDGKFSGLVVVRKGTVVTAYSKDQLVDVRV